MFMLRMIGSNSGDFVCTQVLHNLWKLYLCKKYVLNKKGSKCSGKMFNETDNDEENSAFDKKGYNEQPKSPKIKVSLKTRDDIGIRDSNLTTTTSGTDCSGSTPTKSLNQAKKLFKPKVKTKKRTVFLKLFSKSSSQRNTLVTTKPTLGYTGSVRTTLNPPQIKRSDEFNNEIRRFQSIKRVNLARKNQISKNVNI